MILKTSVTKHGVQPAIWFALGISEMVYRSNGLALTVTSLTDSHEDRPASLHNKGLAVDLRTRNIPLGLLSTVHGSLVSILKPMGFDVVLESNHIHVEWDPKGQETWQRVEIQIA